MNNTENSIDNATKNLFNNLNDTFDGNNDIFDITGNEEDESIHVSGSTNENFIENDSDFDELTEQTEFFAQYEINTEDMRNLHPNTNCTVLDVHCMIYAFFIRHNITWTAVQDLLLLINRIIGKNELQTSVQTFKKKISNILNCDVIKHFFCHNCDLYLGTTETLNEMNVKFCPSCRTEIQTDTKYKKNHFASIPLKKHLHDVLARNRDNLNLSFETSTTEIRDVIFNSHFQYEWCCEFQVMQRQKRLANTICHK